MRQSTVFITPRCSLSTSGALTRGSKIESFDHNCIAPASNCGLEVKHEVLLLFQDDHPERSALPISTCHGGTTGTSSCSGRARELDTEMPYFRLLTQHILHINDCNFLDLILLTNLTPSALVGTPLVPL